jgi:hypothetical protein
MRRPICNLGIGGMLLVFAGSLFVQEPAWASSISMGIDRTRFEFSATPGETLHGTVVLSNDTDSLLPIHVQSGDFEPQGEDGKVAMGTQNPAHSLKDWIVPTQIDLVVPGRGRPPIDFDIHVPSDAKPGAYWGNIILRPPGNVQLATIILVNVLGGAPEKLTVTSFEETTSATGALTFTARFKNDGELYEKPKSAITVQNIFGQTVAEVEVQPENVLPGYIRRFTQIIPGNLWPGLYEATLKSTYGEKAQTAVANKLVWILPQGSIARTALAGFGLLLVVAMVWTLVRRLKTRLR